MKHLKDLKDKKIIGCVALVAIFFLASFFIYGQRKNKVFKDEYMKNIFVDEEGLEESVQVNGKVEKNSGIKSESAEVPLKKSEVTVEIKGEVKNPKVYTLPQGSIINDLIDKAGGLTVDANILNINRAKVLKNEDLIVIENIKNVEAIPQGGANGKIEGGSVSAAKVDSNSNTININTADLSGLMNIDGIGEKTAQKIIDYREENGGFKSIEDIKNVDRIGDKTFEKMKDKISC
ncbi:ComEA family DNA-binding protein [Clostridium gasigenes]|uniref:ComEA family DNA-binding protein n=1 Tax=Clostridium gasigenes TaxID=94869 RepID=UPI001C0D19A3|nr:ComEA family DNA-binding protein [Clostridium gasigenes]MBU3103778.1 ComEA family DNA-binding protein [Clostridium gasigenes]